MDAGSLALFIPIMALSIPFFAIWTRHKERVARLQVNATAENTAERAAQYTGRIQELEDRVRVLERIVTDRGYDVATQIEALRDQRRVEDLLDSSRDSGVPLDRHERELDR